MRASGVAAGGPVLVWPSGEAPSRVPGVALASCWLESPRSCWCSSLGMAVAPREHSLPRLEVEGSGTASPGSSWSPSCSVGMAAGATGWLPGAHQQRWMRCRGARPRWILQGCWRRLRWGRVKKQNTEQTKILQNTYKVLNTIPYNRTEPVQFRRENARKITIPAVQYTQYDRKCHTMHRLQYPNNRKCNTQCKIKYTTQCTII